MHFPFRNRRTSWSKTLLNAPTADRFDAGSRIGPARQQIILWVVFSFLIGLGLCATSDAQTTQSGSSSRPNRELAVKLIPFAQLNEATRSKISEVVESASLYRRLPLNSIVADPEYFRFLVRYPEVVVNIWQLMGVTQMTTQRTGPFTIDTDDGAGTISTLDLVYGNENLHVFFGTGAYEGPVFKRKLNGRCVLVLRTDYRKDALGKDLVVSQMDVFLKLDNVGANLMAKTIQPIVGPTADQNFLDSLKFIQRLNESTVENGPGVQHMAGRLNIEEDTRQKFVEAAGNVFSKASSQAINTQPGSFTVPSLTGHANQAVSDSRVGTAGYSLQSESNPNLIQRRNSGLLSAENPIPAYQPPSRQSAPIYRSNAFSRQ